jgi:hypothetical protein
MKRETVSKIERGLLVYPLVPETTHAVSSMLDIPEPDLLTAMGYRPFLGEVEDEAAAVLLSLYLDASDDRRQIALLALMQDPAHSDDPRLESLRRLAARDRQDRQGTQE